MIKRLTVLFFLFAALSGLLVACGGRTEGGALEVAISGLPEGLSAAVTVSGPGGFSQTLAQSQTLTALSPGSYTVTAQAVAAYSAVVSGSPALVEDGATRTVSVSYGAAAGGSISGTVSLAESAPAAAPFVPGEVIVKFKPGLNVQALSALGGLERVRDFSVEGVGLYRSTGLSASRADAASKTRALVAALSARDDVLYAHPNYLLESFATPNDPLYGTQWHYPAINLPSAWDRTTGSSGVTVAVLDSGILSEHPDLMSKLEPGYDFVSNPAFSGDGDGRDGDPADPNDVSDYHGSHVAGTIAAATNNGVGVAGVSWGARILPVRVLGASNGQSTGTLADAIDGILWSVGESVPGVPNNPNPADVLNLSLGGPYACGEVPALQDAFDTASATGAAVVVAAGNENVDANGVTPASCGGVVTVGATTLADKRASYSNYGSRIDVMAPGGDRFQDLDGNGKPDGVLSTVRNSGGYTYDFLDGTSMASPHVAGAIALLKSVRPALSGAEARDILMQTAVPISDSSCSVGCGAGLIDVAAALAALSQPVTPDFSLSVSPAALTLNAGTSADVLVTLSRSGGFDASVTFSVSGMPSGLSAAFEPPATSGSTAILSLSATAALSGTFELEVQATGGSLSRTRTLSLVVTPGNSTGGDVEGTYVFACPVGQSVCVIDELPHLQIGSSGSSALYTLTNVPNGSYYVNAWKDINGNGRVDAGEPVGSYPSLQTPEPVSPSASGIDVVMSPALGTPTRMFRLEPSP